VDTSVNMWSKILEKTPLQRHREFTETQRKSNQAATYQQRNLDVNVWFCAL